MISESLISDEGVIVVTGPVTRVSRIGELLHGGPVGPADLESIRDKLYFHRGNRRDALVRFSVLLLLSTVVAAGGVVSDSTATVIGAMIIAPLMTPIMATALAIVTGDATSSFRSLLTVAAGAGAAVALSYVIALLSAGIDLSTNSQVVSRVSPRLMDLVIAVAVGAVGAFALSRANVSDILPGVAIAISLVPPLAVVGISLEAGSIADAAGALLLFSTNVLAIVAAGGGMLLWMGYGRVAREASRRQRRAGTIVVAVALVLIFIPLGAQTVWTIYAFRLASAAERSANSWVAGTDYEVAGVTTSGQTVTVVVDGTGQVPGIDSLATSIRSQFPGTTVLVQVLQTQHLRADPPTG